MRAAKSLTEELRIGEPPPVISFSLPTRLRRPRRGAARDVRESLPQRLSLRRQPHHPEQSVHPRSAEHPAVLHLAADVQLAAVEPELSSAADDDAGDRLPP